MTDDDAAPGEALRDWDAFAALYDEHHGHLYRLALLLGNGRAQAAEDAVAETFVRAYGAWREGRVEHFGSYARQALVNHVLGVFRSEQVAERFATSARGDDRGHRELEEAIVDSDAAFALLSQLPVGQRTAIVLRFYEDLSYEAIAATMNVSVGTAQAHVSMGLKRLREQMRG